MNKPITTALTAIIVFVYSVAHAQTGGLMKINGVDLFVKSIGSGPPLIVIHGGPGLNHDYFLPHLLTLSKNHRLIFYDQRACGQSSAKLDSAQVTMSWLINDIEGIRTTLGLGKITVMAHSWGGLLGIRYAAEYPQNVNALILVNTISPRSGEFEAETNATTISRFTKADSTLRVQTIRSDAFRAGDVKAFNTVFMLTFKPAFYDPVYSDSLHLNLPIDFVAKRKVVFFMANELRSYDHYSLLKDIKCPTLIIHGDYDAIPEALPEKIKRNIKNSEVKTIAKAGHFPFIEKREEFLGAVNLFLQAQR
jgi:proline iminopeptidase